VPLVTAVYAGQPQLAQQLEVSVRAQQNNDNAVAFGVAAGRILEQVGWVGWARAQPAHVCYAMPFQECTFMC
jgi:phosphodiesterase/alkaline phosphatase D-like protein